MKVVVSAEGAELSSAVDPRFGRCSYFVVVETETMKAEGHKNEARGAMGGAGIQAAQMVDEMGVKVVLTGNVGPNAFSTLDAAGIEVYVGMSGTVEEAVETYKKGEAKLASSPTNPSMHGGRGGGRGMGGGRGQGRGMGGGGFGKGRGRGGGRGGGRR